MVIVVPWIFRLFVKHKYFVGITLWPFIILRDRTRLKDKGLINHERIHLRQQLEMLLVIFYLWYLIEYLIRLAITKKSYRAYRRISFEQEAYNHEYDFTYVRRRRPYAWFKFVFRG